MLEEVELVNFLSHKDTKLRLAEGVNVFVGPNGAGKSSIIDAVTYALFGEHTRGENANLVRRGAREGWAAVTFSVNGRRFRAERKFDARGRLMGALLAELRGEERRSLIAGERKGLEESMGRAVQELLGLDYEKLRVAAVIQQGQLDAIIEYDPKRFKELINSIVGIDRLDRAYEAMNEVLKGLRARLRERCGYDDQALPQLRQELESAQGQAREKAEQLAQLKEEMAKLEEEERLLERRRQEQLRLREAHARYTGLKESLIGYVRRWKQAAEAHARELEDTLRRAAPKLEQGSKRAQLELALARAEELEGQRRALLEQLQAQEARLQEQLKLAERLEFRSGICPVCGARVERINPLFDRSHLEQELSGTRARLRQLAEELRALGEQRARLRAELQEAREAASWLEAKGISGPEDLDKLTEQLRQERERLLGLRQDLQRLPLSALAVDEHAAQLVEQLSVLEEEARAFEREAYEALERQLGTLRAQREAKLQAIAALQAEVARLEDEARQLERALQLLEPGARLLALLEEMRQKVYHRDGLLALSLRSWALGEIARRATEYVRLFELGIAALELREGKRALDIICRGPRGEISINALSGGERVAVALALRFGMAALTSKGRLDFIILDEPTAHLDRERKEALVTLLNRFNAGEAPLQQIVIITHDEEVFGHASVNELYRFVRRAEGSHVRRAEAPPPEPEFEFEY